MDVEEPLKYPKNVEFIPTLVLYVAGNRIKCGVINCCYSDEADELIVYDEMEELGKSRQKVRRLFRL